MREWRSCWCKCRKISDRISTGIVAKVDVGTIADRRFRDNIEGVNDLMDADEKELRR